MDLLKSKIRPMYFRYLAAASGSAVVASVFGVVDAMMVGQYHGPAGNAALAVFNPIWSIVFCLGLLAGIGGSVLFASSRGRGDETSAQEYFTLSVLWGLLLSAAAVAGIGLYQDELFRFFGADDELLALAKSYLKPILFAVPCCVFNNILSAALRNDGNPGLATKAVIVGGVFNMLGDYYLVFVRDMGIAGAGLATAMAQYVTILIMLLHFVSRKNTLRLVMPTRVLRKMGAIAVNGFSTAISDLALGIIGILFNRQIMRYLGTDALAVYGIITQITAFVQCMAYGTGQAAQPIISQNYGAGNFGRIRECLKYALYTSAAFGGFWTLIMLLMPVLLVYLFMTPTQEVLAIAPGILRAYGSSFVLLPFNIFATYYFQAMMKPQLSLAASVARSVVVSGGMILLLPLLAGAESLWYAMLLTEILVAVFGAYYTVKLTKNMK
jgi:putative MATE family efflux protein